MVDADDWLKPRHPAREIDPLSHLADRVDSLLGAGRRLGGSTRRAEADVSPGSATTKQNSLGRGAFHDSGHSRMVHLAGILQNSVHASQIGDQILRMTHQTGPVANRKTARLATSGDVTLGRPIVSVFAVTDDGAGIGATETGPGACRVEPGHTVAPRPEAAAVCARMLEWSGEFGVAPERHGGALRLALPVAV